MIMTNYIKLLLHLKNFEGDGNMHPIVQLFDNKPIDEVKNILQELSDEGFIIFTGGESRYLSYFSKTNILTNETVWTESPNNEYILNTPPPPLRAKITFKGSKYLKEELQMQEAGKYNISVSGQGATTNFVIESQNVNIDNKANFVNKADKIIDAINNNDSIENTVKAKVINDLTIAKKQIDENGKVSGDLMKTILEYGSNISSIAQLVLALFVS
jgi:hypothetical protein